MPGRVTPIPTGNVDKTSKWTPEIGDNFSSFLKDLPSSNFSNEVKAKIKKETRLILSSCHDPRISEKLSSTGLVVGRVQSGKTTSFKALTSIAVDNGFNLFIIFAGRTDNLIKQNKREFDKLKKALGNSIAVVTSENGTKDWKKLIPHNIRRLNRIGLASPVPLVLITNKHAGHIKAITRELKSAQIGNPNINLNTLIIDDEADNASLNTASDKDNEYAASSIYKSIKGLRSQLSCHSVVQYTATPQSLLLISKEDHYSPEWARLISPGEDYVGAQDLFSEEGDFYNTVPDEEVSSSKNISNLSLPKSFKSALKSYLIASAQRLATPKYFHEENSTFMVHPDIANPTHKHWENIIKDEISLWRQDIEDNLDKFLEDNKLGFLEQYESIRKSNLKYKNHLSPFEDLYYRYIPDIIMELVVSQVNQTNNNINWDIPHNILVGGYMLDRGYVVRGLVTTYMPRGKGGGMIDSLQQRGRFYGYKRQHLSFIKGWMTLPTINAYKSYAEHETHLYEILKKLSNEGKNLREWERVMLLDKGLSPCRKNVISIGLKNNYTSLGGWYWPKYPSSNNENKDLFNSIINFYRDDFKPFEIRGVDTSNWTEARSALEVKNVDLSLILDAIRYYDPGEYDEGNFATVKTVLSMMVDRGFKATIVLTGTKIPNLDHYATRTRPTISLPLNSTNYFQGAGQSGDFPGERKLISNSKKVVTFHLTKLFLGNNKTPSYILAIKLPAENYLVETESV